MEPEKQYPTGSHAARRAMLACHQCDLVQYEVALVPHTDAHCIRCNALFYRGTRAGLDFLIALASGGALMFFVANIFPIASMEIQGVRTSTTLSGTTLALLHQGKPLVAALVFATTLLLPALQLAVLLYLLMPLRLGYVPHGISMSLRFLLVSPQWSMIDVFLLGVLITLVKLTDLATVVPGVALWALAGGVVLSTAVSASFNTRDFWTWAESANGAHAPKPP